MKLVQVSIHAELLTPPSLKDGWTRSNWNQVRNPSSPKFERCGNEIVNKQRCGHLVFVETVAAHYWLREVLVKKMCIRASCSVCVVAPVTQAKLSATVAEYLLPPVIQSAIVLGKRVSGYLRLLSSAEEKAIERAQLQHGELLTALTDFRALYSGSPRADRTLLGHSRQHSQIVSLLSAYTEDGQIVPQLRTRPSYTPRFGGAREDVLEQAHWLYRTQRGLTSVSYTHLDVYKRQELEGHAMANELELEQFEAKRREDEAQRIVRLLHLTAPTLEPAAAPSPPAPTAPRTEQLSMFGPGPAPIDTKPLGQLSAADQHAVENDIALGMEMALSLIHI